MGQACLEELVAHEGNARAGDVEAIHQMRVALRRLRAALSSFSPFLSADARGQVTGRLRWLSDTLGAARNLDVFTLDVLSPARPELPEASEMVRLAAAIEQRQYVAHAAVRRALASRRYRASQRETRRWFEECGWRTGSGAGDLSLSIDQLAPQMLGRCFRRAKKLSTGFAQQSDEQRHRLRIALKKLRYSAELLCCLYDRKQARQFIAQLKGLQEDLGQINDLRVAGELVADLVGASTRKTGIVLAADRVLTWHRQRLDASAPALERCLAHLFDTTPFWPVVRPVARPSAPSTGPSSDIRSHAAGPIEGCVPSAT